MKDITEQLKKRLFDVIKLNATTGLLFSGGLDTSILAAINPDAKAITISLESYGEDIKYSNLVKNLLNIEYFYRSVHIDEAIKAIPEVVRILKSFDPAIPNDIVVYFGLKFAKELGITEVMTGDGADELFAGYNFMQKIDDMEGYIKKISQDMRFSSNILGNFLGIRVVQPFLNNEIIKFALSINPELKLRRENTKIWGKWILRKAFEDILPKEIIWQNKRALEIGSGMSKIREIISRKITDEEFKENRYPMKFINKEHLYYYKVYKDVVGEIQKPGSDEKPCPGCGAGIKLRGFHCKVCGYTLDWRP
ncbi:MAG: asparagine synthase-related protein [Candidatus Hydrogenedentota bacterium]